VNFTASRKDSNALAELAAFVGEHRPKPYLITLLLPTPLWSPSNDFVESSNHISQTTHHLTSSLNRGIRIELYHLDALHAVQHTTEEVLGEALVKSIAGAETLEDSIRGVDFNEYLEHAYGVTVAEAESIVHNPSAWWVIPAWAKTQLQASDGFSVVCWQTGQQWLLGFEVAAWVSREESDGMGTEELVGGFVVDLLGDAEESENFMAV